MNEQFKMLVFFQ